MVDLDRPRDRDRRLSAVRERQDPRLDRRDAAAVVDVRADRRAPRRERGSLRRAIPALGWAVRRRNEGDRLPIARVRARVRVRVRAVHADIRAGPVDPSERVRLRAAARRAAARARDLERRRLAALARCRLPRRVLHQDRHRAARRDAAVHADRLGRPRRDPAGVDRLARRRSSSSTSSRAGSASSSGSRRRSAWAVQSAASRPRSRSRAP